MARYEDFLRDVLITIHMNIRETRERKNYAEPEEMCHIDARLQAYNEVIAILRESADEFGIPGTEFGL